jgi:aryl-alcohol dehydrogenase-like predicted oxidoreductase
MEMRNVGDSGLITSLVGLGCNNFGMRTDKEQSTSVVHAALDSGYTMFDTSDSYGKGISEEYLGAALGHRRGDVLIATKFSSPMGDGPYMRGASRHYVISACEASLRRLGTDSIDLYYLHRPDPLTPIAETLDALSDLVHQGKVRYIGASNFAGWQVADAAHVAKSTHGSHFVANQVEWSLLARDIEAECVPACRHFGVGVIPYFPLASGMLTGKYMKGQAFPKDTRFGDLPFFSGTATEQRFDQVERLRLIAEDSGRSLTELAMSWLAARSEVSTILVGATKVEQVEVNAMSVNWQLDADDLAAVDAALIPSEVPS